MDSPSKRAFIIAQNIFLTDALLDYNKATQDARINWINDHIVESFENHNPNTILNLIQNIAKTLRETGGHNG